MSPGVSVCLPVFNGAKTIRTAIESVLSQTGCNLELLIVDDGSGDETYEIARSYEVRLFRTPNGGVARARNLMLSEAQFELIAFIDHDDIWSPDKLIKQIEVFQDEQVVLAHANCRYLYPSGVTEERVAFELPSNDPFAHLLPTNQIITSSATFRKSPIQEAGGFRELARCSDWLGWFELAVRGKFVYDPQVLVTYAVREDSLANAGLKFHEAQFEVLDRHVLSSRKRLFGGLSKAERKHYHHLARRSSGVALSSMSSCEWKDHHGGAARRLAARGLIRAPKVFRVWTRAWRAFTKAAGRPH